MLEVVVNNIVDGIHPFWAMFEDAVVHTPVNAMFRDRRRVLVKVDRSAATTAVTLEEFRFPIWFLPRCPVSLGMPTAVGRMILVENRMNS